MPFISASSLLAARARFVLLLTWSCWFSTQAVAEVFELRTYTVHDGKLDALNSRFRDHTVKLFRKHGMESVGYWVPADEPTASNTLIYVLRHSSREAARKSWAAFIADPEWKQVYQASREQGPIVKKVESVFMEATDYSPEYSGEASGDAATFELRIYKTEPGKLANLDQRFRDHTIRIFNRFGMTSVAYWHPTDEPDSENTLIYILKHDSREAAKESWRQFIADAEWKKVAEESQQAGRILKERPSAIFLKATDYSAIK